MHPSTSSAPPPQATHGASQEPDDGRVTVAPAKPGKLLRLPAVMERVSLSRSSIYSGVIAGTFPAPVRLSARAIAWREEDISRWSNDRIKAVAR